MGDNNLITIKAACTSQDKTFQYWITQRIISLATMILYKSLLICQIQK